MEIPLILLGIFTVLGFLRLVFGRGQEGRGEFRPILSHSTINSQLSSLF